MLNVPRRELAESLHLDLVDHRVEDLLPRPIAGADEHWTTMPFLYFRDLSPKRIVAVWRRERSWAATIGCDARFSSVFAVECERCGAELRPAEAFV